MRVLALSLIALVACGSKSKGDTLTNSGPTPSPTSVDISKLEDDKRELFYKLVDSLQSPCGHAESLRTAYANTTCKRGPFAARYVIALLEDELAEDRVREEYTRKYESTAKPVTIDVTAAPRIGASNAPIRLVEFFDYACPHCADFAGVLEQVIAAHPNQVAEYFMMFPLGRWPTSRSAAQAAIAANAQQKFKEMHELLFQKAPAHGEPEVKEYAKQLGLDVVKFEQDYKAAAAQVDSDRALGEVVGIEATPTLFFNNRKYEGPLYPKYLNLWIEEEIAVNR